MDSTLNSVGLTDISHFSVGAKQSLCTFQESELQKERTFMPTGSILAGANSNAQLDLNSGGGSMQDLGQNKWCSFPSFVTVPFVKRLLGFQVSSCHL